jgi:AmiR/NasT family two-component response regulator
VYQAQGMVMIQLGVPLGEAMARLRAHAYAQDRTLGSVARDIVARTLTLEADER